MSNSKLTLSCKRKNCTNKFKQIHSNQEYCSPECKDMEIGANEKHPEYRCEGCNKMIQLSFNPIKEYHKWASLVCSKCGYKRKVRDTI